MEETALQTIDTDQVSLVVSTAPEVLHKNQTSVTKANDAGQFLLDTIEGSGMSDELDEKCNRFLVKVRTTISEMNDRRKPITQIMDLIKKEFTTLEAQLDPKNANSVYARIQVKRDGYARFKIDEQRRKEQEVQRKLALDKELISLRSEIQMQLATHFNNYLSGKINEVNALFSSITLEHFESTVGQIRFFSEEYPQDHFKWFVPSSRPTYAVPDQVMKINSEVMVGKYEEFRSEFTNKIRETKNLILDRVHSRKTELEEIAKQQAAAAKAQAEAKSKAEKEAADRESARLAEMKRQEEERALAESTRLKREEEERKNASESAIRTEEQAATTNSLFDAQQTIAEASATVAPVRESYEIEVLNPIGYLLIAQFYFEHEGKNEDVTKLEKKTLGSMKKFCESYAMKNDVKIASTFLKYQEKFKTIAKK
jgi:hypothetical protein